jgi:hypothetical protein
MDINKKEKLKSKLPDNLSKLSACFNFVNNKVLTRDNLFEVTDYHLFNSKAIAFYYQDIKNKNNYNVIAFTEDTLKKISPKQVLKTFERGVFYNSEKERN